MWRCSHCPQISRTSLPGSTLILILTLDLSISDSPYRMTIPTQTASQWVLNFWNLLYTVHVNDFFVWLKLSNDCATLTYVAVNTVRTCIWLVLEKLTLRTWYSNYVTHNLLNRDKIIKPFLTLQLSVVVSDTGVPSLTSSQRASVIINVIRNQFPPNFISTPYATTINRTVLQGTNIFTVSAVDQDTQVWDKIETEWSNNPLHNYFLLLRTWGHLVAKVPVIWEHFLLVLGALQYCGVWHHWRWQQCGVFQHWQKHRIDTTVTDTFQWITDLV